ncbi:DUF2141 domain-containing protein [Sphingomonas jaspsi]|uniref:DUF2141 domain-containing protein n=1 Tax=Sphingomonas jaspsi TaxID=392409 RepID=UPI0004AC770B|nr:DUF2141 domain-containing protein [Sphingomonas jaspsi]
MAASPAGPKADLTVSVEGLRNDHGAVMLCLTRRGEAQFLQCNQDPAKVSRVVPAGQSKAILFEGLEPGDYSVMMVHDENRNGKLDKMMGIPKEGFAFSRNPAIRMGPPHYADVHFMLTPGAHRQVLHVKYLL